MKRASASCSNLKRRSLSGCFAVYGTRCASLVALAAISAASASAAPPAKPGPGTPIAPPGGSVEADRGAADTFWEQLPHEARDGSSNLSYPLEAEPRDSKADAAEARRQEMRARATDTEIMGGARTTGDRLGSQLGEIDRALGLEPAEFSGPVPSLILGIKKLNKLFKEKELEEALVTVNELLRFYPESAQLLMMKGTLHQRFRQFDLALMSYKQAFRYHPIVELKRQIEFVQSRINERDALRAPARGVVIPGDGPEVQSQPSAAPKGGDRTSPDSSGVPVTTPAPPAATPFIRESK